MAMNADMASNSTKAAGRFHAWYAHLRHANTINPRTMFISIPCGNSIMTQTCPIPIIEAKTATILEKTGVCGYDRMPPDSCLAGVGQTS